MKPEISVVVPAYNAASTIDICVAALLRQSIPRERYEIIVVDDGSTDDTGARAARHGVRVHRQPNGGPASARNHGARHAVGKLLLFTDSDCEPSPNWIEAMIAPFADPRVVAAKGSYRTHQRSIAARFAQLEFEERYDRLEQYDSIDMIDTYAAAYRLETFRSLGGFDPAFPMANAEDTDLSYQLHGMGARMVFVRPAVVYHRHPDSLRRYIRIKYTRGYWRMVLYKRYPKKILTDTYTPQTLKLQCAFVALAAIGVPAGLVSVAWGSALVAAGLFGGVATTLPFVMRSWRLDRRAALAAPVFLIARAAAIGAGAAVGTLSSKNTRLARTNRPSVSAYPAAETQAAPPLIETRHGTSR